MYFSEMLYTGFSPAKCTVIKVVWTVSVRNLDFVLATSKLLCWWETFLKEGVEGKKTLCCRICYCVLSCRVFPHLVKFIYGQTAGFVSAILPTKFQCKKTRVSLMYIEKICVSDKFFEDFTHDFAQRDLPQLVAKMINKNRG